MSDNTTSIRRLRSRRINATTALAAVLPLVALGAAALARPDAPATPPQRPTTAALTTASLVCPKAAPGDDTVTAALGIGGHASVTGASDGKTSQASLSAGVPTVVSAGSGAQILTVNGSGAPTLTAARWSSKPLAATACSPAATGMWFTGLGAGPYHDSVIELSNPLSGEAVVDLDVLGAKGPVQADRLQGVAVPAHGTVSFDLLHTIPRLDTLSVHATVVRGQAAVSVHDLGRVINSKSTINSWLSGQRWPSTRNLLLGLLPHGGTQHLVIANPGDSQLDGTLKLVTSDSIFAPAGAPHIELPPQSVVTVDLDQVLGKPAADGALGIELDTTGPVSATLRRTDGDDLTTIGAGSAVVGQTRAVVPPYRKKLVVAGAKRAGVLEVQSFDDHGHALRTQRLKLTPQQGSVLTLPENAVLLTLKPDGTSYVGSVLVDSKQGATVLPLRSAVDTVRVPAVRPALH